MNKKGQVSMFAIIGVVLVIIIMLLYFLNDQGVVPLFGKEKFIASKMDAMKDEVNRCVNEGVKQGIEVLGKQGGDFTPESYVKYMDYNVKYYSQVIPGEQYVHKNNMPFLGVIEGSFENYMKTQMNGCINPGVFESGMGYDIKKGLMDVDVLFNEDSVEVNVNYDITVKKDETTMKLPKMKVVVSDTPFEDLYNVAYDIVSAWSEGTYFDQLTYMLEHKGKYIINVDKPYPDIIYKINKEGSSFELWFAVQGSEEYIL